MIYQQVIYQPVSHLPALRLTSDEQALVEVAWVIDLPLPMRQSARLQSVQTLQPAQLSHQLAGQAILLEAMAQLAAYFTGKHRIFTLPIDFAIGTPFQQTVWQALLTIPYGTTISYAELASLIDKPRAYRAVANANSYNPISIIVPCHRVIASNSSLGGYNYGGLDTKRHLLMLEQALLR